MHFADKNGDGVVTFSEFNDLVELINGAAETPASATSHSNRNKDSHYYASGKQTPYTSYTVPASRPKLPEQQTGPKSKSEPTSSNLLSNY